MSIWWSCLVVFRLHGNDANVWGILFSDFFFCFVFCFCFLFLFFIPPSDPKSGKSIDAKRIKRGWSKPYGFFLGFVTSSLLCISVFLFFVLFCFVFFFSSEINWNWNLFADPLYLISFLRCTSAHIKIKSVRIYWPRGQWGGVRVRYCASVHSRAVKQSKTKGKTSVDILFTSRHQISLLMKLISSPCPRIRIESRCWRQLRVPCLFVAGTCFTRTFPQLRSAPSSCQPRETDDVLYKNKDKLFSICSAPYSRNSVTGLLQTTPHPLARRAVVARGITF